MSSVGSNEDQRLAYQMVQYLEAQKEKMPEKADDLDASIRHISAAFGFDHSDAELFKAESFYPTGLKEIFQAGADTLQATVYCDKVEKASQVSNFSAFVETVSKKGYFADTEENSVEYLKRHAKVVTKFQAKVDSAKATKADPTVLADEKKAEGNALLAKKQYNDAIASYSEAINLAPKSPSSHIYYCNRAAARCHIQQYREAIEDCEKSIECNQNYAKAYSRLGLAHFFLKEYAQSITAYEEGLRLEPNNKSFKESLEQAKAAQTKERSVASNPPTPPAGMPDLSSLAGMMGGGGGGMPDIASLMKNPQMMSMAQEMMKNPAMMQQAMSMMGGMGGGGGMPDMSALAGMMGGMGGGSDNGIPDFSGFSEDNK